MPDPIIPKEKEEISIPTPKEEKTTESVEVLEAKIVELENQVKGLSELQSKKDKQLDELHAKLSKIEEEYKDTKTAAKEKGVDLDNLKELSNINELKASHDRINNILEVAAEVGLSPEIAKRIQGDSKEEMKKDAENLKALFSPKTPDFQKVESPKVVVEGKKPTAAEMFALANPHSK